MHKRMRHKVDAVVASQVWLGTKQSIAVRRTCTLPPPPMRRWWLFSTSLDFAIEVEVAIKLSKNGLRHWIRLAAKHPHSHLSTSTLPCRERPILRTNARVFFYLRTRFTTKCRDRAPHSREIDHRFKQILECPLKSNLVVESLLEDGSIRWRLASLADLIVVIKSL